MSLRKENQLALEDCGLEHPVTNIIYNSGKINSITSGIINALILFHKFALELLLPLLYLISMALCINDFCSCNHLAGLVTWEFYAMHIVGPVNNCSCSVSSCRLQELWESLALSSPSHAPQVLHQSVLHHFPVALSQMHMLCVSLDIPAHSLARSLFLSSLNASLAFLGGGFVYWLVYFGLWQIIFWRRDCSFLGDWGFSIQVRLWTSREPLTHLCILTAWHGHMHKEDCEWWTVFLVKLSLADPSGKHKVECKAKIYKGRLPFPQPETLKNVFPLQGGKGAKTMNGAQCFQKGRL